MDPMGSYGILWVMNLQESPSLQWKKKLPSFRDILRQQACYRGPVGQSHFEQRPKKSKRNTWYKLQWIDSYI